MLKSILSKNSVELSQSLIRLSISSLIFISTLILTNIAGDSNYTLSYIVGTHTFLSMLSLYFVYKGIENSKYFKIYSTLVDIIALSLSIYVSDISMVFVYPLYYWIIVGSGIRFGSKYFYGSLFTSVVTFSIATHLNPEWNSFEVLSYSLTLGFLILALFYNRIIIKLHNINTKLDAEVLNRTKELEYRLYHDRLTNLKNRYALKNDIKDEFSAILLLDIDKFQNFNELYGMEIGNKILVNLANFIEDFASDNNYEAYSVYTDGYVLRSKDKYLNSEKIFEDINKIFDKLSNHAVSVNVSDEIIDIEVDVTIAISMEKSNALEKANIALKNAKKQKKKFLAYYKALNSQDELEDILFWRKSIKNALLEDRIVPLFQPIVDKNTKVIKYEALIRIKENGEYISPLYFLDIAIKTKQYDMLTNIMIEKSFKVMSKYDFDFSINLLFSDIKNRDTIHFLREQILKYKLGHRLILEIVESEDIEDYTLLKDFIVSFRELGARVAIDDFGSGFSNFRYILDILPDYIKIDGSLIKEIDSDTNSYKLVSSIAMLASSLGIKTIAEYVHKEEILTLCQKVGIDEYQGYFFSAPIDEDELHLRSKELCCNL